MIVTLDDVSCTAVTATSSDPQGSDKQRDKDNGESKAVATRGGDSMTHATAVSQGTPSPSSPATQRTPESASGSAPGSAPGYLQTLLATVAANVVVRINSLTLHLTASPAVMQLHISQVHVWTAADGTTWRPGMCQVGAQQFAMHKCVDVTNISLRISQLEVSRCK